MKPKSSPQQKQGNFLYQDLLEQLNPRAFSLCNACLTASQARLQAFRGKDLQANPYRADTLFLS